MYCAATPDRLVTKNEVAEVCEISVNHLAQVINQLSQLGFLKTHRGRSGGISLARPAEEITIGEVFRALEGETLNHPCFADPGNCCPLHVMCRLRVALQDAAQAFFASLDGITLDELIRDNFQLLAYFEEAGPCLNMNNNEELHT